MRKLFLFFSCYLISLLAIGQMQEPFVNTILGSGYAFCEGPVWRNDTLLFTAISSNTIHRWTPTSGVDVFMTGTEGANGLIYNDDGNLILAQHVARQLGKLSEGIITTIVSSYGGDKFNSPNDMAQYSDGTIFFTDPIHGLAGRTQELAYTGVFSVETNGTMHLLDNTLNNPNGIAFSPDYTKLYVVTTGNTVGNNGKVYVFDVDNNTTVSNKKLLANHADMIYCDGMCVDAEGYLYVTNTLGISILNPSDGSILNTIPIKDEGGVTIAPTNCTFGGEDGRTLFVTANNSVYKGSLIKVNGSFPTPIINGINNSETLNQIDIPVYPNPFSESINIHIAIEKPQLVIMDIYSTSGKKVTNLVNSVYQAGEHTVHCNPNITEKGIYFVQIALPEQNITKSFRLMKI